MFDIRLIYNNDFINTMRGITVLEQLSDKEKVLQDLKDAISRIKLIDPKEQKKQKECLKKLEKELGSKKFQDFLLIQSGLN